jgi:hypothetical protein
MSKFVRGLAALTALMGYPSDLHPRESQWKTGALSAQNAEIIIPADGCSTVSLFMNGTFSLTNQVLGTVDGVNWTPVLMRPFNQASVTPVISITGTTGGLWVGKCGNFIAVKVQCTAFTSGACNVFLAGENGLADEMLFGQMIPGAATVLGTAGAAATLTIPAPGTGLRTRLQSLFIARYATAALTASATPGAISTTNLPGSLALTFAQDALALGQMAAVFQDNNLSLPGLAQNTASTIVLPATTGVLWRAHATFDTTQ